MNRQLKPCPDLSRPGHAAVTRMTASAIQGRPRCALGSQTEYRPTPASRHGGAMLAEIDAASAAFAGEHKRPGLVAGIVDQGRLVHVTVLGLADREAGRPVGRDTAFLIASMTKNMCPIIVALCCGKQELDENAEPPGIGCRVPCRFDFVFGEYPLSPHHGAGQRPELVAEVDADASARSADPSARPADALTSAPNEPRSH